MRWLRYPLPWQAIVAASVFGALAGTGEAFTGSPDPVGFGTVAWTGVVVGANVMRILAAERKP